MAILAGPRDVSRIDLVGTLFTRFPVVSVWVTAALVLALCHLGGYAPLNDLDDVLKLVEIRNFLHNGAWFDRTIQGILQPEPFVSHWIRLVDLPYAAVAAPLAPLVGREAALAFASFSVPLVLLLPAIYAFRRIIVALGFEHPNAAFFMSFLFMLPSLFEFAPDRIDYHNLELVFLLLAIACSLSPRPAGLFIGALTALTLALSVEFLFFFLLLMAVFAGSFVFGQLDADRQLSRFGAGLAFTALLLYVATIPPGRYGAVACDSYSTPHLFALVSAGISFVVAGALSVRIAGPAGRIALLGGLAAISIAALIIVFPECRAGPYGALSTYAKEEWLFRIGQEKNILQRADIALSPGMAGVALLIIGALAPPIFALRDRLRSRELAIFALFCLVALFQSLLYLRYLRYTAFFAGPGMMLVFAACAPDLAKKGNMLAGGITRSPPSRTVVLGPALVLVAGIVAFHLTGLGASAAGPANGADFAGNCRLSGFTRQINWPQGASLFAPPNLGLRILAAETTYGRMTIVATPHHPSWRGVERVYRFLDPRTQNPREYLDRSKATHVVVCAWDGPPLVKLERSEPLTAALIEGHPPAWLAECPLPASSSIRVYRYPSAGEAASSCPTTKGASSTAPGGSGTRS